MNKIIALLLTFILGIWLPASAQFVGQAQTINDGGFPQWIQQDVFPSISANPSRSVFGSIIAGPTATTFANFGGVSFNILGSTITNAIAADGNWINCSSAATINNSAGIDGNTGSFDFEQSPRIVTTIKTGPNAGDIQNCRIWVGLFSSFSINTTDTPTTVSLAAFRYATGTDGTAFWRCCTCNGTTLNTVTTTSAIASNTQYTLAIDCTGSSYNFYVNGTQVASTSTDLPAGSSLAAMWVAETTTANSAINFKLKDFYADFL